jgi:hypothetical protein
MAKNLREAMRRAAPTAREQQWMFGVSGIVAESEDPERQARVKVIIPVLDENAVYDKWVTSMMSFVLGRGFGGHFIPPLGAEVLLFGYLGEKYTLFYTPCYNEDFPVPADFPDSAVSGFRVPADFKLIAEGDMQLRAGRVHIEADAKVSITAPGGLFINGKPIA